LDRLVLRPQSQGDGTYLPAVLKFCASSDWPTADPECVGLQAPAEVDRYNLYWPIRAPLLPSCIAANTLGQMSFVACGLGVIQLAPGDAVFPDNNGPSWNRQPADGFAGPNTVYIELRFTDGDHAMWTFSVPTGFITQPTLKVWGERGADGDEWFASLRCVFPNTVEDWTAQPFDSDNEGTWMAPGNSGLNLMQIPLINKSGMTDGDLCQLDLEYAGDGLALVYYLEIN
jgi:hypothetical protein